MAETVTTVTRERYRLTDMAANMSYAELNEIAALEHKAASGIVPFRRPRKYPWLGDR